MASAVGEGRRRADHPEPRQSPCRPRRPSGKSAQAARAGTSRARCRAAAAAGGTRRGLPAAASAPGSAPRRAPPRTPPSAAGPARAKTRSADAARDPGRSARPRAARSARVARWSPGSRRRGRRRAGQHWLCAQRLDRAGGGFLLEVHPGAARFPSAVPSSPLPRPRFMPPRPPWIERLEGRKRTNPIFSDQTVWGLPIWVSFPLVVCSVCGGVVGVCVGGCR